MARVSVVVATSNRKDALAATLDSILKQKFLDIELIVSDDGSSDGTGVFVLSRLGPDPSRAEHVWRDSLHEENGSRSVQMQCGAVPVRYLHQIVSRGVGAARNRAIHLATGDYLCFADPGDVWAPARLESQIRVLEESDDFHACVTLAGGTSRSRRRIGAPAAPAAPAALEVPFDEALTPPGLVLSGALIRRGAVDWEGPFDENLPSCEEYDFWLRVATRFRIARIEEDLHTPNPLASGANIWSLDRYRVYAMEKSFQSGHLSPLQRHRVATMLIDCCGQLADGYRQRANQERANFYDRKRKRFASEVSKLDLGDPILLARGRRDRRATSVPA